MRRNGCIFSVLLLMLVFLQTMTVYGNTKTDVSIQESDTVMILQNSELELRFQATDGSLVGMKNKYTDTQLLGGTDYSGWTMFINTSTDNIWEASLGDRAIKGKDCSLFDITSSTLPDGVQLNLTYNKIGNMDITLVVHVTLKSGSPISEWTAEIINQEPDTTITAFVFPQITGIQVQAGEELVWPYREGQIISDPGSKLRYLRYPMPASMQWMSLYTEMDCLYYAVLDDTAAYKEFRFGYDPNLLPSLDNARMMSVALWPYSATGTSYRTPIVEVGVWNEGNWYCAADRYKTFIETAWGDEKHHSSTVNTIGAITNKIIRMNGETLNTYAELPDAIAQDHETGIHNAWVFGWNDDGFDTGYPDFDFIQELGGASAFTDAITQMHQQGDTATAYLNVLCADMQSDWYRLHQNTENIVGVTGDNYYFALGENRTGVYICPCSKAYQEQLASRITALRDTGADNVFLDQAMELDALQCFNPDHGHTTPATAYAEGLKTLITKLHEVFGYGGSRDNYYFMAEGINDYLSTFVDVGVPAAYRRSEYASMTPALVQYTVPAVILAGPAGEPRTADEFAAGFLMGQPLYNDTGISNPMPDIFNRIQKIYLKEPEIYNYGTYQAQKGMELDDAGLKASGIVSRAGDTIGVQFSNPTALPVTATLTLDYGALHLSGEIESVRNLEVPDETVVYNAGTSGCNRIAFTVTIPAYDIRAYKIALQSSTGCVLEAESANILGSGTVLMDPAASNGRKVGCLDTAGNGLAFPGIPKAANGITIRYSRGWQESCSYKLYINDKYQCDVTFLETGAWNEYLLCSIPVDMSAGDTVSLVNENGGNTAVDVDCVFLWDS
ncbi:DUF6259 domain-containing protein [Diplocloster hominis]|uniref:DUF6259 domain-containing protein n=1 Tax=Diplocloster hominis TaxID=3079010 RepID=UPI0031BA9F74